MKLRLSTEFNLCHSISDHNNNLLACISTNTPCLPEKLIERFNAFEGGGLVGELVEFIVEAEIPHSDRLHRLLIRVDGLMEEAAK